MQVACKATRALVESMEANGIDPRGLVDGLPFSVEFLRNPGHRISWDEFVSLLERLERICPGDGRLEQIGLGFATAPAYARVDRIAGHFVRPAQLYWFFARWLGPAQFPGLAATASERADGRIEMLIELPDDYRPCEAFFRICEGGLAAATVALGLGPARVEAVISGRRGAYIITPPASRALLGRLARLVRARLRQGDAAAEFEQHQTELRASYEALIRSRADFRQLIEQMTDSVCVQRDGRIVWGNRAFATLCGHASIDELIGRPVLELIHPDDRASAEAGLRRPSSSPGEPACQLRVLRGDASIVELELAPPRTVDFDGSPADLVVGRDVTDRNRVRSRMLIADRMASLGILAASVAHEINNPLAYVHANLAVASREAARLGPEPTGAQARLRGAVGDALEGSERVLAIVRDMNLFARGDEETLEPVDVKAVIGATVGLARKPIEQKARLTIDVRGVPYVSANRARLGQVLLNLILNAGDAVAKAAPQENEVAITATNDDRGNVVIEVRDTGCGIAREHLDRIFDPFFTTKPIGEGTGLGLSVCHRIVGDLGGTITVESPPGRGSTFRVSLPAAPGAGDRAAQTPWPHEDPGLGPSGRVLLVEDEPHLLRVLRGLLAEVHDVEAVSDGRAALELLLGGGEFDVILCDLMMDGGTGMDLHAQLAARRPGLEERIVFMTGGAFTGRGREFLARVDNRCLEKPFHPEEMLAAIRSELARRGAASTRRRRC